MSEGRFSTPEVVNGLLVQNNAGEASTLEAENPKATYAYVGAKFPLLEFDPSFLPYQSSHLADMMLASRFQDDTTSITFVRQVALILGVIFVIGILPRAF